MKVTVRYGASLTVPHPTVPYANVKPTREVEVEADTDVTDPQDTTLENLKGFVHSSLAKCVDELHALLEK